jgi:tRNA (Thr-GGU) A37 N-methylase
MDFSVGKFVSKDRMINPNSMNQAVTLEPIGTVVSGRTEIEDDNWGSVISVIQLDNQFSPEVTAGLSDFSHIEELL